MPALADINHGAAAYRVTGFTVLVLQPAVAWYVGPCVNVLPRRHAGRIICQPYSPTPSRAGAYSDAAPRQWLATALAATGATERAVPVVCWADLHVRRLQAGSSPSLCAGSSGPRPPIAAARYCVRRRRREQHGIQLIRGHVGGLSSRPRLRHGIHGAFTGFEAELMPASWVGTTATCQVASCSFASRSGASPTRSGTDPCPSSSGSRRCTASGLDTGPK